MWWVSLALLLWNYFNAHSKNHLHFQQNYTSCNVTSFLALPSPSLSLTSSSPTSFCPSPLSLSLLYPAPSPLPPSSSPLLFLQILCYLFRTCKWRSTTPETLRRLTCTSEGRRWQRWWALLPLSSRRMDTESLACSSNVDSTTISLTPLTSLVSHVMSCDGMWSHVMSWMSQSIKKLQTIYNTLDFPSKKVSYLYVNLKVQYQQCIDVQLL